jgi:hypothetical protein
MRLYGFRRAIIRTKICLTASIRYQLKVIEQHTNELIQVNWESMIALYRPETPTTEPIANARNDKGSRVNASL